MKKSILSGDGHWATGQFALANDSPAASEACLARRDGHLEPFL
jgi:hypothetical protein